MTKDETKNYFWEYQRIIFGPKILFRIIKIIIRKVFVLMLLLAALIIIPDAEATANQKIFAFILASLIIPFAILIFSSVKYYFSILSFDNFESFKKLPDGEKAEKIGSVLFPY